MCGIIAYGSKQYFNQEDYKILYGLINESNIRGLHSFGCSFYDVNNNIQTYKFCQFDKFQYWYNNYFVNQKVKKFIYHNRYSTFGSNISDELEIQPIIGYTDFSLSFNGVLSQKDLQQLQLELGVKFISKNDGELFILNYNDRLNFINNDIFSFSGVWLTNNEIHCLRNNNRPAYSYIQNDKFIICSTKDIFIRNGFNGNLIILIRPFEEQIFT